MAVTADIAKRIAEKHNAALAEKPAGVGHNSQTPLKSYFDRRKALEEERMANAEDIKELNKEAKDHGINPRALAFQVKRDLEDADKKAKRIAFEEVVDTYATALGMLD